MSIFRSNMRTISCLLTIILLASVALVGCHLVPSANTTRTPTPLIKSLQTSPTPTVAPVLTPTLPILSVDPGQTKLFQHMGVLEGGASSQGTIGAFTTPRPFAIWTSCVGGGSFEIDLGDGNDTKMSCNANVNTFTPLAPTSNTHYIITATLIGPAQWEVLIETRS